MTSLAILSIVGMLILGTIFTTRVEMAISRNDATSSQAQYVAQAGLQKYKAALFQNFRWLESDPVLSGGSSNTDACSNSLSEGLNFDRDPTRTEWNGNRIDLTQENVTDVNGDVIGTYTVSFLRDPNNESRITLRSVGRTVAGSDNVRATSTATATYFIRNSSTLEQAVFAGSGSGMRFINGNTTIYGGVYIMGDKNNPDAYVIEANGDMSMFNGYSTSESGNPIFLVDAVRSAGNLCAALRVESGKVAVGGSTLLGEPDNRLLTVAVDDGLEDVDTSQGGTTECKGNKGVCSEMGITPFDISEPPVYPKLDESPDTHFCPDPKSWRTCIQEEAIADGMVLTTGGGSTVTLASPNGESIALKSACQAALDTAAASPDKTLTLSSDLDCTVTVNSVTYGFTFNPGSGGFKTYGNVNFRGLNLEIASDSKYRALSRDENGVTRKFAGLSLEAINGEGGDFTALASFVADETYAAFPDNVLSIVAEGTVSLVGQPNDDSYTAAIYAGTEFRIRNSTKLFGQVIADIFCTTNDPDSCSSAGSPAEVFFVPTGDNRPQSYRAIAPRSGLPTFVVEAYELR
ncbi:MAG: hypothetical protein WD273_07130 [Trueperaceae bacterium]